MVGYSNKYPQQAHHRGASIISIHEHPQNISCKDGYNDWFNRNASNPNLLAGAVVGGPDKYDHFADIRSQFTMLEPTTYVNSPLVGVLAKLYSITCKNNRQC